MSGHGECPFCARIWLGEYDDADGDVVSFEPLNPVTPGHRLFVPTKHVLDAASHHRIAGNTFQAAASYAAKIDSAFNLITSAGGAASQTVPHLHVHYVPRRLGDGLALPWTSGDGDKPTKPLDDEPRPDVPSKPIPKPPPKPK